MLTARQADILKLLTDFKYLRGSHVKGYMAAKHKSSDEQTFTMLNQLRFMGKIQISDGYVLLPGRKMNADVIKAFDVVMSLIDVGLEFICPGTNQFTLIFSVKADTKSSPSKIFGVVVVEPGSEHSICGYLRSIDRGITVIFILSDIAQKNCLRIENNHYFAIQGENGSYKFFKAADQPQKEV